MIPGATNPAWGFSVVRDAARVVPGGELVLKLDDDPWVLKIEHRHLW